MVNAFFAHVLWFSLIALSIICRVIIKKPRSKIISVLGILSVAGAIGVFIFILGSNDVYVIQDKESIHHYHWTNSIDFKYLNGATNHVPVKYGYAIINNTDRLLIAETVKYSSFLDSDTSIWSRSIPPFSFNNEIKVDYWIKTPPETIQSEVTGGEHKIWLHFEPPVP